MADHEHTCAVCGHVWDCTSYTKKQCLKKGVFMAAKINKAGPYCWVCYYLTMGLRHLDLRGGKLKDAVARVDAYERKHNDAHVSHPFE